MVQFTSERLSPAVTRIRDGSDVCMYLVEGTARAALIDTGYGLGNLKGYVAALTGKPLSVYITHGHVDHAAGAAQFDTVHMHPADRELYTRHCTVEFRRQMVADHTQLTPEDADFQPMRTAPFAPLGDGDVTDLGGVTLRWIHVPGHTQGMMVALLPEERTVFFGDACGVGVLLSLPESGTVVQYKKSLEKLRSFEPQYDVVLRQHGSCTSTPHVLEDNLENCEKILAGTDDAEPAMMMGVRCCRACATDPATGARKDGREGNIVYDPAKIR